MFKQWWTQLGKNANIKDLKMNMVDILNAAGYTTIDQNDVRLWLYQTSDEKKEKPLHQACNQVKAGFEG